MQSIYKVRSEGGDGGMGSGGLKGSRRCWARADDNYKEQAAGKSVMLSRPRRVDGNIWFATGQRPPLPLLFAGFRPRELNEVTKCHCAGTVLAGP